MPFGLLDYPTLLCRSLPSLIFWRYMGNYRSLSPVKSSQCDVKKEENDEQRGMLSVRIYESSVRRKQRRKQEAFV